MNRPSVFFCLVWSFLLLVPLHCFAQNHTIDSLQVLLQQHPQADTIRVNLLNMLAAEIRDNDYDQSTKLAKQALTLAQRLRFYRAESRAARIIANNSFRQDRYPEALQYCQLSLKAARKAGDAGMAARTLNTIGVIYQTQYQYLPAIDSYLQASKQYEKANAPIDLANTLSNIGLVYKNIGENDQALVYLNQALKIKQSLHDTSGIALVLLNIGRVYDTQDKFVKAIQLYEESRQLAQQVNDYDLLAGALSNLCGGYQKMGRYPEAFSAGFRSLNLYRQLDDPSGIAEASEALAGLYLKTQRLDSALFFGQQTIQIQKGLGIEEKDNPSTGLVAEIYAARKDFPRAYRFLSLYKTNLDSLTSDQSKRRIIGLQFKYDLEKKQSQIALLQKDQQLQLQRAAQQRQLLYESFGGVGLLLLLAGLLVRNNRVKHRAIALLQQQKEEIDQQAYRLQDLNGELHTANEALAYQTEEVTAQRDHLSKALEELKATQAKLIEQEQQVALYQQQLKIQQVRNTIAAELHDDIGSTLSSIRLFSEVAKKKLNADSQQALPMLEQIESSSQEMMQAISEIVWAIQPKNDNTAPLVDKIQAFADQLLSARGIPFLFEYPIQFISLPLSMETRRNIYLICKETLHNIAKHSQASQVEMTVHMEENTLCINIEDNGRGFAPGSQSQGNGLVNLYRRAEEMDGSLQIDSYPGQGTRVSLQCRLP